MGRKRQGTAICHISCYCRPAQSPRIRFRPHRIRDRRPRNCQRCGTPHGSSLGIAPLLHRGGDRSDHESGHDQKRLEHRHEQACRHDQDDDHQLDRPFDQLEDEADHAAQDGTHAALCQGSVLWPDSDDAADGAGVRDEQVGAEPGPHLGLVGVEQAAPVELDVHVLPEHDDDLVGLVDVDARAVRRGALRVGDAELGADVDGVAPDPVLVRADGLRVQDVAAVAVLQLAERVPEPRRVRARSDRRRGARLRGAART